MHSNSLLDLIHITYRSRQLLWQLTVRELTARYKGSVLGLGWSFITPLLLLLTYTFVFSVVFNARWHSTANNTGLDFALILFVGLILHSLFADVLNRAPKLVLENANFVSKVVFPLEILVVVNVLVAVIHAMIGFVLLLIILLITGHSLHWEILFLPIVFLPLIPMIMGAGWLLAALGVYLRDIHQVVGLLTTLLLFLAPIFYPMSAIPTEYQSLLLFNPLTVIVEQARGVVFFGVLPDWLPLLVYTLVSVFVCQVGFWVFQRLRGGFADVV